MTSIATWSFGPERAAGMNACATALRQGIPFSIHCDCNVTPLGGLVGDVERGQPCDCQRQGAGRT